MEEIDENVNVDKPTSFLDHVYVGCAQCECNPTKSVVEEYRKMSESRKSARATEKLLGGSGARGCVMAIVGTADVPAASGTSCRAAVPSRVSAGIYKVLEMRDGDKGILKAVVNINDIIAHKLLGMNVWEQPEIDKLLVETLDGIKNEWC